MAKGGRIEHDVPVYNGGGIAVTAMVAVVVVTAMVAAAAATAIMAAAAISIPQPLNYSQ